MIEIISLILADRCSHMKLVVPVKIQGCKSSTPVKIGKALKK